MTTRKKPEAGSANPLRVSDGFRQFVLDQLEPVGGVVPRSMFGGVGLYCDDVFFGIIAGDVLYLKVDAENRGDYEAAGAKPFMPYPKRSATMQYYAVPIAVLENPDELAAWTRKALAAAARKNETDPIPDKGTRRPRRRPAPRRAPR
jgi:DNA transformation protein and related proteins